MIIKKHIFIKRLNSIGLILILSIFFSCKTSKPLTDGYVKYQFNLSKENTQSDKINKKGLSSIIEKKVDNSNDEYSLMFYNDSVRVDDFEGKRIFIPKEYKKIVNRKNWKTEEYKIINFKDIYENGEVNYEISINKNDKIKVLGITGYKIEIKETFTNRYNDVLKEHIELYISEKFKFPLNYYDFLRLKRQVDLKGLILKAKIYNPDSPLLFNNFVLEEFNIDKQDRKLIKVETINNLKYKY